MGSKLQARLAGHFEHSIQAKRDTLARVLPSLEAAGRLCAEAIAADGRILACGNGGSAADAQHFSAELLNRFVRERRPLPAIALTTDSSTLTSIANDYAYDEVFAKQVQALGRCGDLLLAISTSGNSPNVLRAIEVAHDGGLRVIALTGRDGGAIAGMLRDGDIELRAAHADTARIQEVHILLLHCLCDAIDELLFGDG